MKSLKSEGKEIFKKNAYKRGLPIYYISISIELESID